MIQQIYKVDKDKMKRFTGNGESMNHLSSFSKHANISEFNTSRMYNDSSRIMASTAKTQTRPNKIITHSRSKSREENRKPVNPMKFIDEEQDEEDILK